VRGASVVKNMVHRIDRSSAAGSLAGIARSRAFSTSVDLPHCKEDARIEIPRDDVFGTFFV
jgi:hypothetical protein